MSRVMLLYPPVSRQKIYGTFAKVGAQQPPLGLLYLAAYLRANGHLVAFRDSALFNDSHCNLQEIIQSFRPDLIGIYVSTVAVPVVAELTCALKQKNKHIPIVIGGPHPTAMPYESFTQMPGIDYVVRGEGEKPLLNLVNALGRGEDMSKISALGYSRDGRTIVNHQMDLVEDIDSLPFPAYDLLSSFCDYKPAAINYRRLPLAAVFTSRGCPFRCVFCSSGSNEVKVRFHSPARTLEKMEYLVEHYNVREIMINDDTFTVDNERVYAICEKIEKLHRDRGLIWCANIQVSTIRSADLLKAMKRSGCWLVMPGIESGNSDILKLIKKAIDLEKVREVFQWAREAGLYVKPSYIIGHPGETEATIEDTIRFAKSVYSHYPSFALMTPFPGTELWDMAKQYGSFNPDDFEALSPSADQPPFVPKGLTAELLRKKQKEAYRALYFDPAMILRHILSIDSLEDLKRLWNAFLTLIRL
jgi:radical SAM superfamily enzyme YgiQ (UPF0313 family)